LDAKHQNKGEEKKEQLPIDTFRGNDEGVANEAS
jgi:hypothetical protein